MWVSESVFQVVLIFWGVYLNLEKLWLSKTLHIHKCVMVQKKYLSNWSITEMLSFHQMATHEIDIGTANWILKTWLVYLSHVNTNICKHPHRNIAINTCLSNDGASYTNDVPESKPKEILPQHWWEVIHLLYINRKLMSHEGNHAGSYNFLRFLPYSD